MDEMFRKEQLPQFPAFKDMLEPCDFDPVDANALDCMMDVRDRLMPRRFWCFW